MFRWQISAWMLMMSTVGSLAAADDLPIVDLGYVRQQATTVNDTLSILTFANIRYGRAPVGELRWARPLPPHHEPQVQRGEKDRICFQSQPPWQVSVLGPWIEAYLSNQTERFYKEFPALPALPPIPSNLTEFFNPLLPAETEDCLFLDVHVPQEIFDRRDDASTSGSPIVVWIHGGGLTLGHKGSDTDFKGFLSRSRKNSREPVMVVSINYRLGAFGFLGGPTVKASGGISNAGLSDQLFALEWVQKYAHHFGGDPQWVTVAGESAGGASIFHHITARGGRGKPPPFQQALIQSGGWNPSTDSSHLESAFHGFVRSLKVQTLQQARKLSSMELRNANFLAAYKLRWGELGFGVEPDGEYVPEAPAKLLREGKFHDGIRVMTGQTAAEGFLFTSPWVRDEKSTLAFLKDVAPTASPAQLHLLISSLYPAIFNDQDKNQVLYKSYLERATRFVTEIGVHCNSAYMAHALQKKGKKMYNYLFDIPPAFHGDDVEYTFFEASNPDPSVGFPEVAAGLQDYFLNFIRTGDPNDSGSTAAPAAPAAPAASAASAASVADTSSPPRFRFEPYGPDCEAWTLDIGKQGFQRVRNPGDNERCWKWQASL